MKNLSLIIIAVVSTLNILVFLFFVGLRRQLRDGPLVLAKDATEQNWNDTIRDMAIAYHAAEFREQALLMAGIFSCFLSVIVLTISIVSLIRKPKNA